MSSSCAPVVHAGRLASPPWHAAACADLTPRGRSATGRSGCGYRGLRRGERVAMAQSAAGRTAGPSRLDRRKARTRQALVDAAVRLIAEGRGERASIQEITEVADIGFGSFYNHFESKDQLFQIASEEVLERWGAMIDLATSGLDDPAEVFAVSVQITGRLGWTHPDL